MMNPPIRTANHLLDPVPSAALSPAPPAQRLDEVEPSAPKQVAIAESVLQLPTDYPKTPSTAPCLVSQPFDLPSDLVDLLDVQAQATGLEVRSQLLAAVQVLLYRYTQQETVGFALAHVAADNPPQFTEVFSAMDGDVTIQTLVQNIQAALHAPKPSASSLTQGTVAMILLSSAAPPEPPPLADSVTTLKQCNPEFAAARDLQLVVQMQSGAIAGQIDYNANLFAADTIERLIGHLQVLLGAIATSDLTTRITQLPMLTTAERHQLQVEWRSPSVAYPQIPIFHHIEAHAAQSPDAIALRFTDQQLTYAELNQRANQLAHYLIQLGVQAGDRVAVCISPSLEIGICLLGILKAGGVFVPLDATHPRDRLTAILEDTQAVVLLTQAALQSTLPAIAPHTFCLDRDWKQLTDLPIQNPNLELSLDQTAYIIYTSGTTGKPKGVMASHRNLINYILATQARFGFNQQDVMPVIARFTFSIAMFELLSPLVAGGTLVVLERDHILNFERMAHTLAQLTMVHTVPSLMQKLLAYVQSGAEPLTFPTMKYVFTGGDTVNPDLLETMKQVFPNAQVGVLYGCSEVSSLCSSYPVPRDQTLTRSSIGQPFNNVQVRLYDPHQNLVPIGVPGEIYISGAGVTKGYLYRDDLTQEKFIEIDGERFYRTGDLARRRADGNLEFLGRADFQVQLRGIRIELSEVEATLRQAPGVREGVVVARELWTGEPGLVAYVVLDPAHQPTVEPIRQFLSSQLPDYMVPSAFVQLDALPLNPNQKVDRRALPVPTPETVVSHTAVVAPRDDLEQQLVTIWQTVLGLQPIGIHNNFFELGGDSLLAVQMLTQVEQQCGKTLPITTLIQARTIAELATVLRQGADAPTESDLVVLQRGGNKPPLFCIYGILLYRDLVRHLDPDQPVYGVYVQEEIELLKTGNIEQHTAIFSSVPTIAARYLQAIRTLQPHGPYHLAGESFGGVVAYEMAQQLTAAGEEVAFVALFDSLAPNCYAPTPCIQKLKLHLKQFIKQGPSYLLDKLRNYRHNKPDLALITQPNAANLVAEPAPEDVRQLVRQRASQLYRPQPYSGHVILFRATERDPFEVGVEDHLGWGTVVSDRLEIVEIPGNHLGILQEPNVQGMANKVQTYLNQTR